MARPIVFLSHATTDGRVARSLKASIEHAFGGGLEVFVASDPTFDRVDQGWLDVVRSKVAGSILMVVVSHGLSTQRPWVNLEIGAAWMRGIPVVCLRIDAGDPPAARAPIDQFERVTLDRLASVLIAEAVGTQSSEQGVAVPSVEVLTIAIREAIEPSP